jgi:phosphoribosylformimino-5-aminoimidazole carboxamide ribotide isomerase
VLLYPAIDVRGGRCVRLRQGNYDEETVYDDDPVAVAQRFEAAGAAWIHVVDLDAARTGERENLRTVEAICGAVQCEVQVGGGIRTAEAAEAVLGAGATRVVVGTAAVERPAMVDELGLLYPGRVAVGLDARGRKVAVRGWTEATGADIVELAQRFDETGIGALVVTAIERDGTLEGPDLELLGAVLGATSVPVVASGGVGALADLDQLRTVEVGGRSLAGVIVGKAFYDGRFDVEAALAALR